MAMPATATVVMLVLMCLVATTFAVVAAATLVAHVVKHMLNLLVGSIAVLKDNACEM